jgi:hypothetical protein
MARSTHQRANALCGPFLGCGAAGGRPRSAETCLDQRRFFHSRSRGGLPDNGRRATKSPSNAGRLVPVDEILGLGRGDLHIVRRECRGAALTCSTPNIRCAINHFQKDRVSVPSLSASSSNDDKMQRDKANDGEVPNPAQPFRKRLPNQAFRPWFAWGRPRRDRGTRDAQRGHASQRDPIEHFVSVPMWCNGAASSATARFGIIAREFEAKMRAAP